MHDPTTKFLSELSTELAPLSFPVFYELPDSSELEPFVVIGGHQSDNSKTAQTGILIEDIDVQIDIFLKGDSRTFAEEVRAKAVRLLGRRQVTSQIIKDATVGREVYHLVLKVRETIF